jgi:TonB family protein
MTRVNEGRSLGKLDVARVILAALAALVGTLLGASELPAQTAGYYVIVNARNGVSEMSPGDVSDCFMKRFTSWPSGTAVAPVDLPESDRTRARFSEAVHGRPVNAVQAHWQRAVFSGRGVPPVQRATPAEVIAFVAGNAGGIGYVPASTQLPASVKILRVGGAGAAAADEQIFHAATVDEPPRATSLPALRYPRMLRQRGIEGHVTLEFVVDDRGRVDRESISVVESTNSQFEAAAIEVVRRAQFQPGRQDGRSVPVQVQQIIEFTLTGGE